MLSVQPGHSVAYLTGPVAGGRESYYSGAVAAGEPAGLWYGPGAAALGLSGEVDADLMTAVFTHHLDPRDPNTGSRATWGQAEQLAPAHRNYRSADDVFADLAAAHPDASPERLAELRRQAERSARQAVAFVDVCFSAPKSVTVLGTAFERAANDARAAGDVEAADAWAAHHRAVEDAVLVGARASVDYLQDKAGYSRAGHHGGGAGQWVDAHQWTVAQFLQHDQRDHAPQLHVHQPVWNRVQCADGVWRTLDSRAIHKWRGAAGAVGERAMEARLADTIGVRFATRPDGRSREVVGVDQAVMDLFSSRRRAVTAKTDELIRAYTERHGREPSPLERTRLAQRATLSTRRAKTHDGETLDQRLDRWEAETRTELAGGLTEVARTALDRRQDPGEPAGWSERDVIERALASLGEARQSFTRSDLTRAISDALPGHLAIPAERVPEFLDGLTDTALLRAVRLDVDEDTDGLTPDLLRADGQSVYANPAGARYALPDQLAGERRLREAAVERGAHALPAAEADRVIAGYAEHGRELGADQAAALRGVLTSGARVESLVAAAGAGKTYVTGAIADAWTGGRVIGLAPSQIAANVLADEGLHATNTAAWLGAIERGDEAWAPQPGDLVVLDEAGMASTDDLLRVHQRCAAAGAKLLLVGDPRQLGAVGAGGAFGDVADRGVRYDLTEVRRFTHGWEGPASIRLRDGDTTALDDYHRHGRLQGGGTVEQAEAAAARAWLADTLDGKDSLLLVDSNEAAARVSAALRARLVEHGRVAEHGVALTDGTVAGVGDTIAARRNAWHLAGYDGNVRAPINRTTYSVREARDDGSLRVVDGAGVTLTLPASYVAEHVRLGYAATVHAGQGRTVDTAHAVVGSGQDTASIYVSMTRGRERNTAWTVTRPAGDDQPAGEIADTVERSARAVLSDALDNPASRDTDATATRQQEDAATEAASGARWLDRLAAEAATATTGRAGRVLDLLAADGALPARHREQLAADPAAGGLDHLLRTAELAGHDPAQVLRDAVTERSLTGSRSPAQVLHARITRSLDLTPQVTGFADLVPRGLDADRAARLDMLAEKADHRRHQLGAELAEHQQQWALEALGPVPDDPVARVEWEQNAGWAAFYREATGRDDPDDALGAAPAAGLAELHATWRAAHEALDLPTAGAAEAELSDGALRARVAAWGREQAWAPAWTDDRLAATEQTARARHEDATIAEDRANTETDPDTARVLRDRAAAATAAAQIAEDEAAALELAGDTRAKWWLHTAATRDHAERARVELGKRGVNLDDPDDRVTAEEWLDEHRAAQAEDDRWRDITEDDVADDLDDVAGDAPDPEPAHPHAETAVPDARDTEPGPQTISTDTVLDTATAADAVARAQAALAELRARADDDGRRAEDDRAEQLARWDDDDTAAENLDADADVMGY